LARQRQPYVPLWVKTNHSFLEGASHPEELVDAAHAHRLPAMAITDRDGLYGIVKSWARSEELRKEHGHAPRIVVGAELSVRLDPRGEVSEGASEPEGAWTDGERAWRPVAGNTPDPSGERSGRRPDRVLRSRAGIHRVLLLAEDRAGYGRLCRLLTLGHARATEKGESRILADELRGELGTDGLVALAPSAHMLAALAESHRGRLYALVTRHLSPESAENELALRTKARALGVPTVAATEVLYHERARQPLQDTLTAIRHGVTLRTAGTLFRPNAEHDLRSIEAMHALFSDDPRSLARTLEIAERAAFGMGQLRYVYPAERLPPGETPASWMRKLTYDGAAGRYPSGIPKDAREQLERELALIEELEYGGYFLTMWDVVRFCREKGILCQGRGSAANSIVCFCLGITAIDPVRMDLLFERFLSRERKEPPDIDIDIEHDRREEVIQYVYERWGRRRAAMVANLIRYRLKSALRDVGKVLGLPEIALDRASKILSRRDEIDAVVIREAGLDPEAHTTRQLLSLSVQLQDYPRHLGVHPGGFLLGHEPVDTLCPVEKATMPGRTVVQWDKQDVEDLGLFKVDLLGLGCLTVIHRAFDTLKEKDEIDLEIATVPAEDPTTYAMISRADTVGVFQIESRAQMSMLPRLAPRTFYDLVIEVALVRPGPIQGDMVHPYLRRRAGKEDVHFPHPKLERVLMKTLGVPIFQEQVMKLAILCAGYTPGESDQLRRDMAAWRSKGRIERHREKLVGRMVEDGIPLDFAERVFSQIQGFGEYGFPESHAASFALLAYVTAWLKCHHPAHFTCAMLNAWPMGFYHPSTLIDDAKRHGITVLPIDVRRSLWDCILEPVAQRGWGIRMGLRYVKGLGVRERAAFEAALLDHPFESLPDFVRRVRIPRSMLERLAQAGAFDGFDRERRRVLFELRRLQPEDAAALPLEASAPQSLARFPQIGRGETISWDYKSSLHSARGHPLEDLRPLLEERKIPEARMVARLRNGQRTRVAGLVICRQRPGTATGVTFMTLEDETGFVNIVVWRDVFEKFERVGKMASLLMVEGKVQAEEGVVHVIAETLIDLGEELTREASRSHASPTRASPTRASPTRASIVEKSRDFH
jgi:error-prone DNA polymerase